MDTNQNIATTIIKLASGAEIEFRKIMLAEENILANASKSKKRNMDQTLNDILTRCSVEVVSTGCYPDSVLTIGGKPNWDSMLRGDRIRAMFGLRIHSYKSGKTYGVENVRCEDSSCNYKFDYDVNLESDLVFQDVPDEAAEIIKSGQPFEVTVSGYKISFGPATGKTDKLYEKHLDRYPGRDMACALRARITDVDGVERRDILDWLDGNMGESKKYTGLTSDDAEELRDAFDANDGGVDTEVEVECPKCKEVFGIDLPFDRIFLPGKGIRDRKKKNRLGRG